MKRILEGLRKIMHPKKTEKCSTNTYKALKDTLGQSIKVPWLLNYQQQDTEVLNPCIEQATMKSQVLEAQMHISITVH
jgi:hypothetical protein